MRTRAFLKFKKILKIPAEYGKYYAHEHAQADANPNRDEILSKAKQIMGVQKEIKEGLNTTQYTVKSVEKTFLYTRIYVYYNKTAFYVK